MPVTPNTFSSVIEVPIALDFPQGGVPTDVVAYWDPLAGELLEYGLSNREGLLQGDTGSSQFVRLVLTVPGASWVTGAAFDAQRNAIIDGHSGSFSFNSQIRDAAAVSGVTRESATEVRVRFPTTTGYEITSDDSISVTVPHEAINAVESDKSAGTLIVEAEGVLPGTANAETQNPGGVIGRENGTVPSTMQPDANSTVSGPSCILHARGPAATITAALAFANGTFFDTYGRSISASPVSFTTFNFSSTWVGVAWTKSGGTAARQRWSGGQQYVQINKSGAVFDTYPAGRGANWDLHNDAGAT